MNADRTVLTDAMRARTDPGAAAADNRQFLEAVPWRFLAGSLRRGLPERVDNRNSAFERFRRRAFAGVFERAFNALSEIRTLRFGSFRRQARDQGHARRSFARADRPSRPSRSRQ